MLKRRDKLEVPVQESGDLVTLVIFPVEKSELFEDEDSLNQVSRYQLQEGSHYQYEFKSNSGRTFQFVENKELITFDTRHANEGTINTGIYVGHLSLPYHAADNMVIEGSIELEVRSHKLDYEHDYQTMLNDIASYYTDLVLQQGSPARQNLEVDYECESDTLYQKFSFVRSVVDSQSFNEAIHKIVGNPIKKWAETTQMRNVESIRRLSSKSIRQLTSSSHRVPLPSSISTMLAGSLSSVPRQLEVASKKDTIDIQENQFVKFVLRSFLLFCEDLVTKKNAKDKFKEEVYQTTERLSEYLDSQFFRQVSMPTHINLNSPVLQRKEGYREVLQAWLIFDLAANLNWSGGDDVYSAGKKNVATLYEYWLFFKMLELISEFFDLNPEDKKQLVKKDNDQINLDLVQGRQKMISGQSITSTRKLNVRFYYNRTFGKVSEDSIHKAGSWTMSMRPDYTLSLWPGEISEAEAERQELIVHIHFDAKYRLNKVILEDDSQQENENDDPLQIEKKQEELGIYKRADLLKMHAYKDAIRRTSGAYVLYPGDENKEIRGFHEIVPGLGAFSIRPNHWYEDSLYLKQFLAEVKAHLLDRTSDREKLSFHQYDIYKQDNTQMLIESLPEPVNENRGFLPDETYVLVCYCAPENVSFIEKNLIYNLRTEDRSGTLDLSSVMQADYVLLCNETGYLSFNKIKEHGFNIYSAVSMVNRGYLTSEMIKKMKKKHLSVEEAKINVSLDHYYTVISLESAESEFHDLKWKIRSCKGAFKPEIKLLTDIL